MLLVCVDDAMGTLVFYQSCLAHSLCYKGTIHPDNFSRWRTEKIAMVPYVPDDHWQTVQVLLEKIQTLMLVSLQMLLLFPVVTLVLDLWMLLQFAVFTLLIPDIGIEVPVRLH